ncbi:hypothetical protein UA08_09414 [Talaromyces atroroseus]|uniref:Zn(2)-C6 fungal-type domain-containing protein n=1 Tax=Talaromyces atroroseus TaxID=1441469 RepID=A0A1Q5Q613_TALAT|nr:hypothetical protein UA08_09414 [Talaromyces atroroseus]OKL55306.1 hypothetical protein UA08_09414 [Talaromyces atroroseus]
MPSLAMAACHCDLQRPVCGHCSRRKEQCRLPNDEPQQSQSYTRFRCRNFNCFQCPIHKSLLNGEELLLYNFVSNVSFTLSDRTDYQTVWSLHVPRDGQDHPHLMHSMLAISALHLAQTTKARDYSDERSYVDLAAHNYHQALSLLIPNVTVVTTGNFDALYASAMLTFLFNIGRLNSSNSARLPYDIAALSELGKGVLAVRLEGAMRHKIKSSQLMREYRPWDSPQPLPDSIDRAIKHIENLVHSLPESRKNKDQYIQATQLLRFTFNALTQNPEQPAMIFMWLVLVDRRFIELLRAKDTMALLILGHYGICAFQIKDKWWAANCGRHIVAAVHDILDDSEAMDMARRCRA